MFNVLANLAVETFHANMSITLIFHDDQTFCHKTCTKVENLISNRILTYAVWFGSTMYYLVHRISNLQSIEKYISSKEAQATQFHNFGYQSEGFKLKIFTTNKIVNDNVNWQETHWRS